MDEQAVPTSIPEVEALILSLYQPNPPNVIAHTQSTLSRLQSSPQAWGIAGDLLARPDEKVKFFGALTIIIKLNTKSSPLSDDDAAELLMSLIGWFLESLNSKTGPLVVRKLSSALATFFLHYSRLWRQFVLHLSVCLLSGRPCSLEALGNVTDPQSVLEQLSPAQKQAVLWVVTNILEDVAKFDFQSAQNMGLHEVVLENLPHATILMTTGMTTGKTSLRAHEDSIKCLQAWVWFAQRTFSLDSNLVQSLRHLFTAVIDSLSVDELFDASVELMIDILLNVSLFLSQAEYDRLSSLFESTWGLNRHTALVQGDFDFDSVRFGQLLLAFGDARVEELMQADDERSHAFLSRLCGLLAAQGHPVAEDKIFVPALEFWSTFAETLTTCSYPVEGDGNGWVVPALDHALQAVSNAWQKVAYPAAEEFAAWDSSERAGFHDARKDVIDLLESVYTHAGPQLVLTFANVMLTALSSSSWFQLEAAAFCLGGLADCISGDTRCDEALATVFTSSLFSILRPGTPVPSRVRQTCVVLIEHLAEYFERNTTHLPPALNLLFAVVGEPSLSAAAAKSIMRLCSSCRNHLQSEATAFLDQYSALVSEARLDCVASEKVFCGIASVIQAIPDPSQRYLACARLLGFIQDDVRRLLELSLSLSSTGSISCFAAPPCTYAAADESPTHHTALRTLRCLASMAKGLQVPSEISLDLDGDDRREHNQAPELVQLQKQVMAIIVQVQEAFNSSGEVTELICSILRSGFSETDPGPFVLPAQDVAHYITRHVVATPRIGLLVSTCCSFVSSLEHEGSGNQQAILSSVLLWVVGLLKQLPNPETDPELTQNGIEFVSRLLNKHPGVFVWLEPQDATEFFFLLSLQVLDGKEPLPKASAAEFWANFITISRRKEELDAAITRAMETLGPMLSQSLARNLGGNASRSELDKLSEPLKKLVSRYPMAKSWLESALSHPSFPSTKVTPEEKSLFVKKVIRLRGARQTNQVVREFWLLARGSNFAYAS